MVNCRSTRWGRHYGAMLALCAVVTASAQTPQSPTPASSTPAPSLALPQDINLPALSPAPTEQNVPPGPNAQQTPNAQMQPPPISRLSQHVDTPEAPAPQITATTNSTVRPEREEAHGLTPNFLGFLGPYKTPVVPPLFDGSQTRLQSLIRDGKLYLTLQDAIALALENNLDVETERYDLVLGADRRSAREGRRQSAGHRLRGGRATARRRRAGLAAAGSRDDEYESCGSDGD